MNKKGREAKYIKEIEALDLEDVESSHGYADDILCKLLDELGYKEVVKRFKALKKWYA